MRSIDAVIFDLDGTLWDTTETCVRAWNRVLDRHAIAHRSVTLDDMRSVTGKTHRECIATVFAALTADEIDLLVRETETEDNVAVQEEGGLIYPGVAEGLATLQRRWPLMIVSNCQAGYIEAFLAFSGFANLFVDHECWGNTGKSKSDNLAAVIQRNAVTSPVFIGDTEGDQRAAQDNDVPFIHVTYGFGRARRPDSTVSAFDQLVEQLTR